MAGKKARETKEDFPEEVVFEWDLDEWVITGRRLGSRGQVVKESLGRADSPHRLWRLCVPGGVGRKGEELVKDGPEPETGPGPRSHSHEHPEGTGL